MYGRQENQRNSVHPDRDTLKSYVDETLSDSKRKEVKDHLTECEFCEEFCEDYRQFLKIEQEAFQGDLPPSASKLIDQLYRQDLVGRTIDLSPLARSHSQSEFLLAADSEPNQPHRRQTLTTQYSYDPEIVLRLTRDSKQEKNYLQLISEDPSLVANVLVQVPELSEEFLTDREGRAEVGEDQSVDWTNLKWQIKMPEAVFELEPLQYDPNKVLSSKEVILETDDHSKIKVTLESRVEGKKLSLQVLQLDGRSDFESVRVLISHGEEHTITETTANELVTFEITSSEERIDIRLFN